MASCCFVVCEVVIVSSSACPQAIHTRDELSEKLQDAEEEITAVVKELQSQQFGIKAANKQMSEVRERRGGDLHVCRVEQIVD